MVVPSLVITMKVEHKCWSVWIEQLNVAFTSKGTSVVLLTTIPL